MAAVEVRDGLGQVGGEEPRADPLLGKGERHLPPVRAQGRGELGADEPAAEDDEAPAALGERAEAAVVAERAEVDDVVAVVAGQAPRAAAGREQEPLVAVGLAAIVGRASRGRVERDDAPPEVQVDAELRRPAPDGLLALSLPEPLRERRPAVGRVVLAADEADRAVGIVVADPAARGIGRHPPAHDQIPVVRHLEPRFHSLRSPATLDDPRRAPSGARRSAIGPTGSPRRCRKTMVQMTRTRHFRPRTAGPASSLR